jgi:hypothetical protein
MGIYGCFQEKNYVIASVARQPRILQGHFSMCDCFVPRNDKMKTWVFMGVSKNRNRSPPGE